MGQWDGRPTETDGGALVGPWTDIRRSGPASQDAKCQPFGRTFQVHGICAHARPVDGSHGPDGQTADGNRRRHSRGALDGWDHAGFRGPHHTEFYLAFQLTVNKKTKERKSPRSLGIPTWSSRIGKIQRIRRIHLPQQMSLDICIPGSFPLVWKGTPAHRAAQPKGGWRGVFGKHPCPPGPECH